MFTFRLNLKTKEIYDDMLKLYNEHFNTKFTIASILPYAVDHFINHGNTNYLKHYNLIKNYYDQEFMLEKELYAQAKKLQNNDITLQDILNFALNLYIVPFKAEFIKKSVNLNRMLLILNHFRFITNGYKIKPTSKSNSEYQTEFIITYCPLCGHDSFYVNPDNMQVGCYKNKCMVNTSSNLDVIGLIQITHKQRYPDIINTIFDVAIKNYKDNLPEIEKLQAGIVRSSGRKKNIKNRIEELEKLIQASQNEETTADLNREISELKKELDEILKRENEEKKIICIKNHILIRNGIKKYDYLLEKGFREDILEELDIFYLGENVTKDYQTNSMRYRICFPIYAADGELAGIQARSIIDDNSNRSEFLKEDYLFKVYWGAVHKISLYERYSDAMLYPEPTLEDRHNAQMWKKINKKILNSCGFNKSEHLYLLNRYVEKNYKKVTRVVIVEGLKDAIKLYSYNLNSTAVVSSMGCSLSDEQVELLKKYFPDAEIILGYDQDYSGVEGNIKAYHKLTDAGFNKISFIQYPNGTKDFGDFTGDKDTRAHIVDVLKNRKPYNIYIMNMIKSELLLNRQLLFNSKKFIPQV
jgi:hypothetical protein